MYLGLLTDAAYVSVAENENTESARLKTRRILSSRECFLVMSAAPFLLSVCDNNNRALPPGQGIYTAFKLVEVTANSLNINYDSFKIKGIKGKEK
jgi:hypothetical protein